MSAYIISGLVLGSIYAIAATGVVLTYKSSRVFNFGHGAIAFLIARLYYQCAQVWHWNTGVAAAFAIFVFAPLVGVFLWAVLFRHLATAPPILRLVSTLGLFVAIPAVVQMVFGNDPTLNTVGLAGASPPLFHVFGVTLNLDQVLVLIFAAAIAIGMFAMIRFTTFGLLIRAVVNSPAVTRLVGTDPERVSMGAWALGAMLAGLAGVLLTPLVTLDLSSFNILMIASFAAVVMARMDNLLLAFAGGMSVGLVQQVLQKFIPDENPFLNGVVPSVPFILLVIFLFVWGANRETVGSRVRATQSQGGDVEGESTFATGVRRQRSMAVFAVWALLFVLAIPLLVNQFWIGLVSEALIISAIFLSFTVISGEAGIISLAQSTLAGVGAIAVGQFSHEFGWPMLLSVILAGACAATLGVLVAAVSVQLGDLYVALTTLGLGLLLENMVYPLGRFAKLSIGAPVIPPKLGPLDFNGRTAFYFLALGVFGLLALAVWNLKRSSSGLELAAVRSDQVRASTLGVRPWRLKVGAFGIAGFVAGVGGSMMAMYQLRSLPSNFLTTIGLVWFAVVATMGMRSISAALIAGLTFVLLPQFVADHFSQQWQTLPTALFGIGAIAVGRYPDGIVAVVARSVRRAVRWALPPAPLGVLRRAGPAPTAPTSPR